MSRIGLQPIDIPSGISVDINGNKVSVKGPKGNLVNEFSKDIIIKQNDNQILVERNGDKPKMRALHGTTRSLINSMIVGVKDGFTKTLELVGVGYRATAKGKGLSISLGFSHPVEIAPIDGISFKVEGNNKIIVEGIKKELVGQVAANIRAKRPPEPYKGKGVKYFDEHIIRKEGKKA